MMGTYTLRWITLFVSVQTIVAASFEVDVDTTVPPTINHKSTKTILHDLDHAMATFESKSSAPKAQKPPLVIADKQIAGYGPADLDLAMTAFESATPVTHFGDASSRALAGTLLGLPGYIDDPEDSDAMSSDYEANSQGKNRITGKVVAGDKTNGMADTDHGETGADIWQGRHKHIKITKGYDVGDSRLKKDGHYYLGTGRRRIGDGFSRRRAPKEVHLRDLTPKERAKIENLDVWADKPISEKTKMVDDYDWKRPKTKGDDDDAGKKPLTKKERRDLLDYIFHLKHGPIFYKDDNYRGAKFTPGHSMEYIRDPKEVLSKDNISSLRVPKGWCATLYDHQNWKGSKKEICNQNVWSLYKFPLIKRLHLELGRQLHTTWNNEVHSFLLTKFHYIQHPPPPCSTPTCSTTLAGKVSCHRQGGGQVKAVVDDSWCEAAGAWPRNGPAARTCPACEACRNTDASIKTTSACLCGDDKSRCAAGRYCDAAAPKPAKLCRKAPICRHMKGTIKNSIACLCGSARSFCQSDQYCDSHGGFACQKHPHCSNIDGTVPFISPCICGKKRKTCGKDEYCDGNGSDGEGTCMSAESGGLVHMTFAEAEESVNKCKKKSKKKSLFTAVSMKFGTKRTKTKALPATVLSESLKSVASLEKELRASRLALGSVLLLHEKQVAAPPLLPPSTTKVHPTKVIAPQEAPYASVFRFFAPPPPQVPPRATTSGVLSMGSSRGGTQTRKDPLATFMASVEAPNQPPPVPVPVAVPTPTALAIKRAALQAKVTMVAHALRLAKIKVLRLAASKPSKQAMIRLAASKQAQQLAHSKQLAQASAALERKVKHRNVKHKVVQKGAMKVSGKPVVTMATNKVFSAPHKAREEKAPQEIFHFFVHDDGGGGGVEVGRQAVPVRRGQAQASKVSQDQILKPNPSKKVIQDALAIRHALAKAGEAIQTLPLQAQPQTFAKAGEAILVPTKAIHHKFDLNVAKEVTKSSRKDYVKVATKVSFKMATKANEEARKEEAHKKAQEDHKEDQIWAAQLGIKIPARKVVEKEPEQKRMAGA